MNVLRNTVFTAICIFILVGIHSQPRESSQVRALYNKFISLEEGEHQQRLDSFQHAVEPVLGHMTELSQKDRALALVMQGGLLEFSFGANAALPITVSATDSCAKAFGAYAPETMDAQSRLGWAYGYTGHLDIERKICQEQLDFYNKEKPRYINEIVEVYNTLAQIYGLTTFGFSAGDRFAEQRLLHEAIEMLDNYHPQPGSAADVFRMKNYIYLYNSLAVSYYVTRNYANALDYARKCLTLHEHYKPLATKAICLLTIGRSLYQTEHNADSALVYLDSSLAVLEKFDYKQTLPWVSYNIYKAEILMEENRMDNAIRLMQQVRELVKPRKEATTTDSALFVHISAAVSQAYIKSGDTKSAVRVCEPAKDILRIRKIISAPTNVALYSQYANALAHDHRWQEANAEFVEAVAKTGYGIDSLKNPAYKPRVTIPYEYLPIYLQAGDMFVKEGSETHKPDKIMQGLQIMLKTIDAFHRKKQFFFEAGIDEEAGNADLDMTDALLTNLYDCKGLIDEAQRMDMAFAAIDASKAGLLKNKLFEDKLLSSLINSVENRKMLELRSLIFQMMGRVRMKPGSNYEDSLMRAKNAYTQYMQTLRKKYIAADQNPSLVTDSGKSGLKYYNGTVVSYFLGAKDLFIHTLNNGRQELFRKKIPSGFKADFDYMRSNGLTKDGLGKMNDQEAAKIRSIEKQWYQWLLGDIPMQEELLIVPHRELSFISFDMLDQATGPGQEAYLLKTHTIRYEMAASFVRDASADTKKTETVFGGFASSKFNFKDINASGSGYTTAEADRGSLQTLEKSNEEVSGIARMVDGRPFPNAQREEFLDNAGKYQVLHVSTHAFADQGPYHESYLVFESDRFSKSIVRDVQLMQLKLKARMAVLSACNTGVGKLNGSEGVNSLGRSFFLSGCSAVVMSLWPANEGSTQEILHNFYIHLKEGQGKARALRQAKLDYLNNANNSGVKRNPYYWAGFVVVGDDAPLQFTPDREGKGKLTWMVLMAAALVAAAGFAIRRIYLRRRANSLAA